MKTLKQKIGISIAGLIIAGSTPVIPQDMQLVYSYAFDYLPEQSIVTATSTETINNDYPFPDSDGDGKGYASVFLDDNGNEVFVEITAQQYKIMGEKGGYSHNTKKDEYLNIIQAFKPKEVSASIAFDASSTGTVTSASSVTYSHTNTGSNGILFTTAFCVKTSASVSGVTYDGSAHTLIAEENAQTNIAQSLWYIVAPSTGANNVVVTANGSASNLTGISYSYTGASQTGVPDALNSGSSIAEGGTTFTRSVTTVADNSWLIMGATAVSSDPDPGAGTTERIEASDTRTALFDSNGAKTPAGSYNLVYTALNGDNHGWIIASFAPVGDVVIEGFEWGQVI